MNRIEMMGTSGVGKTTLYRKLANISAERRTFLTFKDAYKIAAIHQTVSYKQFRLWLFKQMLKSGWFDKKAWGLGKAVLKGLEDRQRNAKTDALDPFKISYTILLEHLKQLENPQIIHRRIVNFTNKIDEYLLLENALPETRPVLIDEGMVHHHPGITEYGFENYSLEQLKGDLTFSPMGIIYCEQSAENVFQQALERKRQGISTFTHGPMESEELRVFIQKSVEFHNKKAESFKKCDVPVLHLNTSEQFERNLDRINSFVDSLY